MSEKEDYETKDEDIKTICDYLRIEPHLESVTVREKVKEICVLKLCRTIGITGRFNFKSDFFDFFSTVMGEALCEELNINLDIACDELRLIRYERINLIGEIKSYLKRESVEEAFLDGFRLADKYKYLIMHLNKRYS